MKKIIAFNWKMNPQSLNEAKKLFAAMQINTDKKQINADIIICPPFIYLNELKNLKTGNKKLGAQNVFLENGGHYTGEISPKMLKNLGVEYVIIGHSERRQILNETDEMINKKVLATLKAGLKIILCVGESLKILKKGKKAVENFIKSQLQKDLKGIKGLIENLTIAYEPVWAIGTGNYCQPKDAIEMIKFIKQTLMASGYTLNPKILYGGSIDGKNIKNFLQYNEIDGFLVGGASLKNKEVKKIIYEVEKNNR